MIDFKTSFVTINASRTNGNRAFVDNQSSFIVGEGSNLHVGTVENTGAVIGKEGNSTFKIDSYVGKDIQNYDTMTTTGGSIGASLGGKPKINNVGFNQDSRDKQGITRNTVIGDVEIAEAEGSPINRDLGKANEITKDTHSRTNINVEPQVIEYISNPAKFKEDLEVAILEGKATGETVLKSIENIVNGGKEDIGDPERRTINEIKEAVIRVKTAPQMESIAGAKDLNSPDILKQLDIAAIEKFNPNNPDLPENVRARLDELAEDGKTIKAFYDKTTNKIFVNENIEDDVEIRASIVREWKISEDLKDEKGKPNEEGRLKATVAGELAYDDMMKRGREGKTESISTDRFADAVMDVNSEVTSDEIKSAEHKINSSYMSAKADESYKRLVNKTYKLGSDDFIEDLTAYSFKSPYGWIKVMSPYFGFYYLEKNIQNKYKTRDEDGDIGLRVDSFDPEGFRKLENTSEYTTAMYKTNIEVFESAKLFFKNNGIKNGEIKNEVIQQNFIDENDYLGIKDKNGIIPAIITPSNLDITYRTGSIISKTIIKVSKNRDNSITIVLIRRHKLYDEFSKPFDLKNGFPDKRELGNKYNLLTNYKNHEIYRGRFKNKDKDIMLKEITNSINMRIKEAKERIGGKK